MSETSTIPAEPPLRSPFLARIILFLMPYFLPTCPDAAAAAQEILETIASYGVASRSEVINAARVIAFSFAALDTLVEAKEPDLSPSLRLRHKSCANGLNRACQQNERLLTARLARNAPDTAPPRPDPKPPAEPARQQEPVNDVPDAEFHKEIEQAEAAIAAYRKRSGAPEAPRLHSHPISPEEAATTTQAWGRAMMDVLTEMGMPMQTFPPA